MAGSAHASAGTTAATAASAASAAKPSIVLVHGAWADSSSWDALRARDRYQGDPGGSPRDYLTGPLPDRTALRPAPPRPGPSADLQDWMVPFSTPPLAALKLARAALPAVISWLAWAALLSCSFVLSPE
jgi:hypothetical protein